MVLDPRPTALWTPRARRLTQFFLVGTTAAGLQTVLLWAFVELGGLHYLVGAVISIELTIVFQYVLNNSWTFRRMRHRTMRGYLRGLVKTNLVRGTAIPIQLALLYTFVTGLGLPYLVANLGAIFVSGIYRYVLDARWTWRS